MTHLEDKRTLPAIHETSRLWFPSEAKTLSACVSYLQGLKPGWSLNWLREAAPQIIGDALSESALRSAVDRQVPERARDSVWAAVELLRNFAKAGKWSGIALPYHDVQVGLNLTVRVRAVGMFYSPVRMERRLIALQPRQDFAPTLEQSQIWISALYYEFCCDPLEPLQPSILDLSRGIGKGKRSLSELTSKQLSVLSKDELDSRLDMVARSFVRARDLVPPPKLKPSPKPSTGQSDFFDPGKK